MMNRLIAIKIQTLVAAAALLLAPAASDAQVSPVPRTAELETHPFEIPGLGLTVHLPVESTVDVTRIAGGASEVIVQGANPIQDRWSIKIRNSVTTDVSLTPTSIIDEIVRQRQEKWRAGKKGEDANFTLVRVFDRLNNLEIDGHSGSRVYLDVPSDPKIETVGFTVLQTGRGQFLIFEMHALPPDVKTAIETYEVVVATARFRDPSELNAERFAAIETAQAFLSRLNSSDLQAALGDEPTFFRLYRPAPSGVGADETEVAYQRVQMRMGQRGDLDPDKPRSAWRKVDREEGFIVRVDARLMHDGGVYDSRAIFFLSTDRESEVWSIENVAKKGDRVDYSTQTLVRDSNGLTVTMVQPGEPPEEKKWRSLPRGYLSRVELYLLPRLITDQKIPGIYGFYTYDPHLNKLTLRREEFTRESRDRWVQSSTVTVNTSPLETVLDGAGRIVRKNMGGDLIMEPTSREALKRLWAARNQRIEFGR
ncbi:MAG: hypothetical protein RIB32_02930 [Phycisphaerales bacterium]